MTRRSCLIPMRLSVLLLVAAGVKPASAQSPWMPRDGTRALAVEVLRPSQEGLDAAVFSTAIFVSGRAELSPHLAVVSELPYARHESSQMGTDVNGNVIILEESSATAGNIYLGVEVAPGSSPFFGELGVRLPLVSKEEYLAQFTGTIADIARRQAFVPDAMSIQSAFNIREVTSSNVEFRLRLSPVLVLPTGGNGADPELIGVYSWQIGYHGRNVRLGTALTGSVLITEDFGNLGERSLNQFELHADVGSWSIRPGFDLHVPLDSWGTIVPSVVGASVSWSR